MTTTIITGFISIINKNIKIVNDNKITKQQFTQWLLGFIDGEGCFSVSISKNRLCFRFSIGLHIDDIQVLRTIQEFINNVGHIYISNNRSVCTYNISDIYSLYNVLIPIVFNNLLTTKNLDANKFFILLTHAYNNTTVLSNPQTRV